MFRTAELGRTITKADYLSQIPRLRKALVDVQQRLRQNASFPVIVVFGGVDGAGKSETVNLLNEWLDPRWVVTRAYGPPSDEMLERPEFWRYWRDLPARGRIGLFLSCWYSRPILDRVFGGSREADLDENLDRIVAFERALAEDGALIIKFWMHLGKDAQKRRLKALEKDPLTRWRVSQSDWENWQRYDDFIAAAERTIMRTSTGRAPWHIVEGSCKRYRSLTVGKRLHTAILEHVPVVEIRNQALAELETRRDAAETTVDEEGNPEDGAELVTLPRMTVLDSLDMSQSVSKTDYEHLLETWQGKVNGVFREAKAKGISTVLVFEGWDAAGKGGTIRRVTPALDARYVDVIAIAAPTDEERAHHYLWRFWRHLSRAGRLTIFDRSWYGRVLVERVEGFAAEPEWRRSYMEINHFEDQLVRHGIVLLKFWLHITKDEQLQRFHARERIEYKRWKLTEEDWRNREKWDQYEAAVNDMVERTSTRIAPWTLVEANDKRFARIKVLKTIAAGIEAGLKRATDAADEASATSRKTSKLKKTG